MDTGRVRKSAHTSLPVWSYLAMRSQRTQGLMYPMIFMMSVSYGRRDPLSGRAGKEDHAT